MLHASVVEAWPRFSEPFEGRVAGMYLDIKALATCAVGILIDPIALALPLPWKRDADGLPASEFEVRDAWHRLKARPDLAKRHVSHARALTGLHLDDADIDELVADKLASNAEFVTTHYFHDFPAFPADAQLAIMSMAWAVGPGFPTKFPLFTACIIKQDFEGAIEHCKIREDGNPGVVPRNRANRVCFANAEIVKRCGLASDILRWPNVAQGDVPQSESPAFLGTLVPIALADARFYQAEAAERAQSRMFNAAADMSEPEDEPTKRVNLPPKDQA